MPIIRCSGITKKTIRCNKKANRSISKWYCQRHTPQNECIICNQPTTADDLKLETIAWAKSCNHCIHLSCYRLYLIQNGFPKKCPCCQNFVVIPNAIGRNWIIDSKVNWALFIRCCINLINIARDYPGYRQLKICYTLFDFICSNPQFLKKCSIV